MRYSLIPVLGVGLVCFFSFSMLTVNDLYFLWLAIELATICLIPCFFFTSLGAYFSLFSYVLVLAISSCLIIVGFLNEECLFLSYLGLSLKFGAFPFLRWIYDVFEESNWIIVWGVVVLLKLPFLAFYYYLSSVWWIKLFICFLCVLTLIVVSVLYWVYTFCWEHYWCHVGLNSSTVFLLFSLCDEDFQTPVWVYVVYFIWCTLSVGSICGDSLDSPKCGCVYYYIVGALVSFPVSINVVYKLFVSYSLLTTNIWFLLFWVLCSLSEQAFLLKVIFSRKRCSRHWSPHFRI